MTTSEARGGIGGRTGGCSGTIGVPSRIPAEAGHAIAACRAARMNYERIMKSMDDARTVLMRSEDELTEATRELQAAANALVRAVGGLSFDVASLRWK